MNTYTSETVEFFTLVLTSGVIAATALAIASLISFTLVLVLFRERAAAVAPAGMPAAEPAFDVRPQSISLAAPAYGERTAAIAG
jgi:hypothetical protein